MDKKVKIPLVKFQNWMQQLLLDPFQQTGVDPKEFLPSSFNNSTLEDLVHHSEKLNAKEHIAIYQRSYIARLRNCMSQQFSALEYALGEEIFCAFADNYLASKPSYNYNLALLGKHFEEYLEANRPDTEEDEKEDWIDFIIELAKFEYAIGVIFEQKADEDYTLAESNTPEENLKLVPICELFKFKFPVRKYYTAFKDGNTPDVPLVNESYCMVLRYNFKLAVYDLYKEQFEFLTDMKKGMNILEVKSKFREIHKVDTKGIDNVWDSWKMRWIETKVFRV